MARIGRILDMLDDANPLGQLGAATYRLHSLKGARKGEWSVSVSSRLRITFRCNGDDAYDIDLTMHYGD